MHHQMWLVVYSVCTSSSIPSNLFPSLILFLFFLFSSLSPLSLTLYFFSFNITHVHMNVMIHYRLLIGIVIITINQDLISSV